MIRKIATFNVNGVRPRLPLLLGWLDRNKPDMLCLQEIKCREDDFPLEAFTEAGYTVSLRGQKAYNGVAILSPAVPDDVLKGFDDGQEDQEARLIAARFGQLWIINTYVPQGRSVADPAFQHKLDFLSRLKSWLSVHFNPDMDIVWTGDINIAPADEDVFDPKRFEGQVGCHPDERHALSDVMSWGFTDLFRSFHPEGRHFTFWDYRLPKGFARDLGWRLDHIYATASMKRLAVGCRVDTSPRGLEKPSDHTPVMAEFDIPSR